jgi:hypothetical protein
MIYRDNVRKRGEFQTDKILTNTRGRHEETGSRKTRSSGTGLADKVWAAVRVQRL